MEEFFCHKFFKNFSKNISGVAIKYKLIGLEQIRSRKEREFKKSLQRRIELIAGMLKLKNQAQIDFRDIEIVFTANSPANLEEQAQIVSQLDGLISKKTLLSQLLLWHKKIPKSGNKITFDERQIFLKK